MSEPIDEPPEANQSELFTRKAVAAFQKAPELVDPEELKHYNQMSTQFDAEAIRSVFKKWKIPNDARITIFGGYTGQFADALRSLGLRVVFTDASAEWVEQARSRGLDARHYAVQTIPTDLLEATDLFASFECYPDLFEMESSQYNKMRLLTAPYGLLFVESKKTTEDMNKGAAQQLGTFRRWFRPINNVYHVQRDAHSTEDLNFYHIHAGEPVRALINTDLRVMRGLRTTYGSKDEIGEAEIPGLASSTGLDPRTVGESLRRMQLLSDSIHSPWKSSVPYVWQLYKNKIWVGSKGYKIVLENSEAQVQHQTV